MHMTQYAEFVPLDAAKPVTVTERRRPARIDLTSPDLICLARGGTPVLLPETPAAEPRWTFRIRPLAILIVVNSLMWVAMIELFLLVL
jgi:hypothetical protein